MLPKHQVVKTRKAIERLYDGTCTVTVHQEYEKDNGSTGFKDEVVLKDEPCHLSKQNISSTKEGEVAATISQVTKLFTSPTVNIPTGSKITVTQNGKTTDYKQSGEPMVYATHQEIILELFDRWS